MTAIEVRELYTTQQVAVITGFSRKVVRRLFDSGRLRGFKIPDSGDRRIPHANLVAFLAEHGMTDALAKIQPPAEARS